MSPSRSTPSGITGTRPKAAPKRREAPPGRESRPTGRTAEPASISTAKTISESTVQQAVDSGTYATALPVGPAELVEHVDRFSRAVILDALLDAWGGYWERRARQLEAARPMPGDFTGRATREELSAQWRRLTEVAQACRARARVSPLELIAPDVDNVLAEGGEAE